MKKIVMLLGLVAPLWVIADAQPEDKKVGSTSGFNFEGIARVNSERIGNTLSWLKTINVSDQQALIDLVAGKMEKIADRIDSLKEQLDKKLSPEQKKELQALKDKIAKYVEMIKNMPPEAKKAWRNNLKFKFDQLPQEIMLFTKKVESSIPEESVEQLKELQDKAAKFVERLKNMPATDKEALQQAMTEKVEKLKERIGVLKQIGRGPELEELKGKIDDFRSQAKEMPGNVKDKIVELYEKAIQALKGGKK